MPPPHPPPKILKKGFTIHQINIARNHNSTMRIFVLNNCGKTLNFGFHIIKNKFYKIEKKIKVFNFFFIIYLFLV